MGGSVLQLRPPALTPVPSCGRAEGTCLQARARLVLVADSGAWLPPPAQRPRLQPLPAHPGHRHPLWGCQAVSFLSSRLPPREAPEGLGALALVRFKKRLLHCPHKNKLHMTPLVPSTFQVPLGVSPECSKCRPGMGRGVVLGLFFFLHPHLRRISRLAPGLCPNQTQGGLGSEELC